MFQNLVLSRYIWISRLATFVTKASTSSLNLKTQFLIDLAPPLGKFL